MKVFKKFKGLIAGVAPTIATALGGPAAGMATRALAGALLGDENASEEAIMEELARANPEKMLELKKADQKFAYQMAELGYKEKELHIKDRGSARRFLPQSKMRSILAVLALFAFGWVLYMVIAGDYSPREATRDLVMILIGRLSGYVDQIYNFFFGSSQGSKDKGAAQNKQIQKLSEEITEDN